MSKKPAPPEGQSSEQTRDAAGPSSHVLLALQLEGMRSRADAGMWACTIACIAANTGSEVVDTVIRSIAIIGVCVFWFIERKIKKLIEDLADIQTPQANGTP